MGYEALGTQGLYVSEMRKLKQALAEKDLFLAQANRHKDDLFAKLAQKDRELELADFTIKECLEKIQAMDTAHQQLMEKAVRFADAFTGNFINGEATAKAANDFLKSPEVQAWKEHQS